MIFAINKAKHGMHRQHLKTLYYSLVCPYLVYMVCFMGNYLSYLPLQIGNNAKENYN